MKSNLEEKIIQESRNIQDELKNFPGEKSHEEIEKRILKPYFLSTKEERSGNEANCIEFVETEPGELEKELLGYYLNHLYSLGRVDYLLTDPREWRFISKLKYRMTETEIDLSEILPDYKVFFCPKSNILTGGIIVDRKIIFLAGSIDSFGGMVTVLHEIGHAIEKKSKGKNVPDDPLDSGYLEEISEIEKDGDMLGKIVEERNASLFALRKIWKELRKNSEMREDVILFLKYAYLSHCEYKLFPKESTTSGPNHSIAEHFGKIYDPDADEIENQERELFEEKLNAWKDFRKSEEYVSWKQLEEFSELDESDEFDAWLEWSGKIRTPEIAKPIERKDLVAFLCDRDPSDPEVVKILNEYMCQRETEVDGVSDHRERQCRQSELNLEMASIYVAAGPKWFDIAWDTLNDVGMEAANSENGEITRRVIEMQDKIEGISRES